MGVYQVINIGNRIIATGAFLAVALTGAEGYAQSDDSLDRQQSRHHVISANPFGLVLLPWYNGEYERRLKPSVSVGFSGSRWTDNFSAANIALRYYPSEKAFQGIYVGPRVGIYRTTIPQLTPFPSKSDPPDHELQVGVGFEFGYAWLLGQGENLSVSVGAGATRLFGGESTAFPVLRFINLGWAF